MGSEDARGGKAERRLAVLENAPPPMRLTLLFAVSFLASVAPSGSRTQVFSARPPRVQLYP